MRISDWSSDVCSSDLLLAGRRDTVQPFRRDEDVAGRAIAGSPALRVDTVDAFPDRTHHQTLTASHGNGATGAFVIDERNCRHLVISLIESVCCFAAA